MGSSSLVIIPGNVVAEFGLENKIAFMPHHSPPVEAAESVLNLVTLEYRRVDPWSEWYQLPIRIPLPEPDIIDPEDYLDSLREEYPNTDWRIV